MDVQTRNNINRTLANYLTDINTRNRIDTHDMYEAKLKLFSCSADTITLTGVTERGNNIYVSYQVDANNNYKFFTSETYTIESIDLELKYLSIGVNGETLVIINK